MKKRLTRTAFVVLCAFTVPFLCFAGGKTEKTGTQEKVVRVITCAGFFPHIYRDTDGNLTGFEYGIIEEIAKRSGYKVEWLIAGDVATMFGSLDAGKADTVACSINVTEARKKTYNFTEPYLYDQIRMVARADDPAKSVDDFQGRKVCIELGGITQTFFDAYNKDLPEAKKIKTVIIEGSTLENLKLGRYDSFPLSVLSFDRVMERGGYDFKMVGDPIIVGAAAYPFSKTSNPELLAAFNKAIKEMHADGTLAALSQQYFKRDVTKEN